jgi:hypothetical protein
MPARGQAHAEHAAEQHQQHRFGQHQPSTLALVKPMVLSTASSGCARAPPAPWCCRSAAAG